MAKDLIRDRTKTRNILLTFYLASVTYLIGQELLNYIASYFYKELPHPIFIYPNMYFLTPAISVMLIQGSYLLMKKYYHPEKEHYLTHTLSWLLLFIPQLIPQFFTGLRIIHTTWSFILSTTVTIIIVFQDFIFVEISPRNASIIKLYYKDLKFYTERFIFCWLTLGSVLAVCMTILWTAPKDSFNVEYNERVVWAVYMVLCYVLVSVLLGVFVGYPVLRSFRKIKEDLFEAL